MKIIEILEPSKLSRSIRSRYALAYAVASLLEGEDVATGNLVAMFLVSKTTAARILREAKQIAEKMLHLGKGLYTSKTEPKYGV